MKLSKIILYVSLISAGLFILFLWFTLRGSVTDVSNQAPYSELIGKTFISRYPLTLANPAVRETKEKTLYYLGEFDFDEKDVPITLPSGTALIIEKAMSYLNGTSGFSSYYLIGTTQILGNQEKIAFAWQWGDDREMLDPALNYRTFGMLPWETERINKKIHYYPEYHIEELDIDYYEYEQKLLDSIRDL